MSPKVTVDVEKIIKEVDSLYEDKSNAEKCTEIVSNTLKELCGEDDSSLTFEAAPLMLRMGMYIINFIVSAVAMGDESGDMEEDLAEAWENLEAARTLYEQNATKDKPYTKELADIAMHKSDVCKFNDDTETYVVECERCLELRKLIYDAKSREVMEATALLGLAQISCCESFAVQSQDEPEFAKDAETLAKKAVENLDIACKFYMNEAFRCAEKSDVMKKFNISNKGSVEDKLQKLAEVITNISDDEEEFMKYSDIIESLDTYNDLKSRMLDAKEFNVSEFIQQVKEQTAAALNEDDDDNNDNNDNNNDDDDDDDDDNDDDVVDQDKDNDEEDESPPPQPTKAQKRNEPADRSKDSKKQKM